MQSGKIVAELRTPWKTGRALQYTPRLSDRLHTLQSTERHVCFHIKPMLLSNGLSGRGSTRFSQADNPLGFELAHESVLPP